MKIKSMFRPVIILLKIWCFLIPGLEAQVPLHPDRGLALIWYGDQDNLTSRGDMVTTGQIMLMWRNIEQAEDIYDFSSLDSQLKMIRDKGLKTTVQVNANYLPDYLFKRVPYLKGIDLPGQSNHSIGYGPVMYWHETYRERYAKLISALASHLRASPYRDCVLAIRQSYCALGTEHYFIPPQYQDKTHWTFETDVTEGGPWPWTTEIGRAYKTWAVDLFLEQFNPPYDFNVFLRACAISGGIANDRHLEMVNDGKLWLFHTSSEPQPRNKGFDSQYKVFVDYCRTGRTYGFMESWSRARTLPSGSGWDWQRTSQPITRAQFNYWTLLTDLHCGASFIAMRPEDTDDPEFLEDYKFASKYAGYNFSPQLSPGVWIAFREGDFLVGDYSFLIERNPNDKSVPLYNLDDEKYGLWARKIPSQESIRLKIDPAFTGSLNMRTRINIRIWYKDVNNSTFRIHAFGNMYNINTSQSGRWVLYEINAKISILNPILDIVALNDDVIVHKIEISRRD
jgi:hypothetical protein